MKVVTLLVCLLGVVFTASAEGLPSSKATADINTLVKCNMTTVGETVNLPASCVNLFTGAAQPIDANGFV
jgi:hypothetical protein